MDNIKLKDSRTNLFVLGFFISILKHKFKICYIIYILIGGEEIENVKLTKSEIQKFFADEAKERFGITVADLTAPHFLGKFSAESIDFPKNFPV